jgi:hypothetical protein
MKKEVAKDLGYFYDKYPQMQPIVEKCALVGFGIFQRNGYTYGDKQPVGLDEVQETIEMLLLGVLTDKRKYSIHSTGRFSVTKSTDELGTPEIRVSFDLDHIFFQAGSEIIV